MGGIFEEEIGADVLTPTNSATGKKYVATNHVVVIIGWDDSKGAWLIKNSWGNTWGDLCGYGNERGYMWIKYNTNNIGSYAAWVEAKKSSTQLPPDFAKFALTAMKTPFAPKPGPFFPRDAVIQNEINSH